MIFEKHIDHKYVSYWLTRAEVADCSKKAEIIKQCPKWKEQGYKVVIFESESESLVDLTDALLRHNLYKSRE